MGTLDSARFERRAKNRKEKAAEVAFREKLNNKDDHELAIQS